MTEPTNTPSVSPTQLTGGFEISDGIRIPRPTLMGTILDPIISCSTMIYINSNWPSLL